MAEMKEEAESTDIDTRHLLKSVQGLQEALKDGITKISEAGGENTDNFLARTGAATIVSYAAAFKSLQVTNKSAFEGVFQKFFRYPEVQESYDELLELENNWHQSLLECEESAGYDSSDPGVPSVGSLGPIGIQLVNARTEKLLIHRDTRTWLNHMAAVIAHQDAIKSLNTKIVVVCFGSPNGARMWLDENGCPFDVLCDENREIYRSLGLKRPASKVWNIEQIKQYAEQLASNQRLYKKGENLQQDPLQMGGDFILDKNGCLALVHASKTIPDRPTVDEMIAALKTL